MSDLIHACQRARRDATVRMELDGDDDNDDDRAAEKEERAASGDDDVEMRADASSRGHGGGALSERIVDLHPIARVSGGRRGVGGGGTD